MGARGFRKGVTAIGGALLAWFAAASVAAQQRSLSHKVMGSAGLQAGAQGEPGVYAVDQLLFYDARSLLDRHGQSLPVGLNARALGNVTGVAATFEIVPLATYVNMAIGAPVSWARVSTQQPEASLDRFGLADLYLQPLQLGWHLGPVDLVAGYAVYVPTGQSEGSTRGVGHGYWTQEPSLGTTVFFDDQRHWSASALFSVDVNGRTRDVDIVRGTTLQAQGGVGVWIRDFFDVGLAGAALWQITADRGRDLPAPLRGAGDRVYTLGPEVTFRVPAVRLSCTVRYEHEFLAESRSQGQVFFLGVTWLAWDPHPHSP
jgi:hypothetical protein